MKALNSCVSFHFGNFGGCTIKILYSLSGMLLSLIVFTGGLLYFKRTKKITWNKKTEKITEVAVSAKQRFIQTATYWLAFFIGFFVVGLLLGIFIGQPIKSGTYITVLLLFPFVLNSIFLLFFLLFYHPIRLMRRKRTLKFVSTYSSLSLYFFVPTLFW